MNNERIFNKFLNNPPVKAEPEIEELEQLLNRAEDLDYERELYELAWGYTDDEFLTACGIRVESR